MRLRSMLFVPADSPRKLAKACDSRADALILDLEDSVAPPNKAAAREAAAQFLKGRGAGLAVQRFVRINPLDSELSLKDLAAVVVPGLDGIMLPKIDGAQDVRRLALYLDALEVRAGIEPGHIRIVPVATETPRAMLGMGSFEPGIPRMVGVTWGAEDLSAAVGAITNREADGAYSPLYVFANSLCLCAAAAAEVDAIDTLHADFRDREGLVAACAVARRRGFRGKIAIHPDQVDIINGAFTPSAEETEHARRIVQAFDAEPGLGALSIDGVMVDLPHLKQARRTLGLQGPGGHSGQERGTDRIRMLDAARALN
ncbi:citrate lyase subunit beta / citryl-CoA lyase [Variovorax sp. HW608]|uniref:HpcH/HpaI aldolase/citrate lyase family protein n=1 Tax=Variovorax sp. HW608 TaxID=1034889 RepID=UPI00082018CF|nr:CoA ester lyase [Variovorax sp. HW608]SCK10062.1 citrate lyase subunit beta / citryl-CoA lyase [Variovorax sp. HW608]